MLDKSDKWPYTCIDWEHAAKELRYQLLRGRVRWGHVLDQELVELLRVRDGPTPFAELLLELPVGFFVPPFLSPKPYHPAEGDERESCVGKHRHRHRYLSSVPGTTVLKTHFCPLK